MNLPSVPFLTTCFFSAFLLTPRVPADSSGDEVFRKEIAPLLRSRCLMCHQGEKRKGQLDLSRRSAALTGGKSGPALQAGKPQESLLWQRTSAGEMPPQKPLTADQVRAIHRWIEAGAPYAEEPLTAVLSKPGQDWWAFQKIVPPPVPAVQQPDWPQNPIDNFVLSALERKGLRAAPGADRRTLIRRATFDLIGLPPTPEEVDAFEADRAPDAYARLVDKLLTSSAYGERWARHWLDVVRFAESHGYETNALRLNAWPYRDYVIRAFNHDIPYPQFILEQLAGDTLPGTDQLVQSATGFLVGGAHDVVGNQTEEGKLQQRMDDLDDMIATTASTFLGLTVHCSRCHDHKFDPIPQKDYYALQAVFAGVQHAERLIDAPDAQRRRQQVAEQRQRLGTLEYQQDLQERNATGDSVRPSARPVNPQRNVEWFAPVTADRVRITITRTTDGLEPCLDEFELYAADQPTRNVGSAECGTVPRASSVYPNSEIHRLEHLNDGQYGNGRSWISAERGQGWAELRLNHAYQLERVVWGRDRDGRYKDRLAKDYTISVALHDGPWQIVSSSSERSASLASLANQVSSLLKPTTLETKALEEVRARLKEFSPQIPIYAGTFQKPAATHRLVRGDPRQPAEIVPPGAPECIPLPMKLSSNAPEPERRQALARWLAHRDNPLPSRVMMNRLWQAHFGQGIVTTPSDFGLNGDRLSHPELLDWLAAEYIRHGWQLKPLHRLILLSATYQQANRGDPAGLERDAPNRFLGRRTARRLEAETLRDALLAISGLLDRRIGGPGYTLWEKNTNYVVVFKPLERLDPPAFRRMVYQFKPRSQPDPVFGIFDCPDGSLARPRRTASTTALQALNLFNSRFVLDQAEALAARIQRDCSGARDSQVRRAFRLAFQREPSASELRGASDLVQQHGLPTLCRALFNANELLYID